MNICEAPQYPGIPSRYGEQTIISACRRHILMLIPLLFLSEMALSALFDTSISGFH